MAVTASEERVMDPNFCPYILQHFFYCAFHKMKRKFPEGSGRLSAKVLDLALMLHRVIKKLIQLVGSTAVRIF